MVVNRNLDLDTARTIALSVADPELPFLTLGDLGIVREVRIDDQAVVAKLTPTYIGCPAVSVIEQDVLKALTQAGFKARVIRVDYPAWTTDWITQSGRQKLKENGISPPESKKNKSNNITLFAERSVICPRCDSSKTKKLSEFGSTPCKAQYRCEHCLEPFDHFKCH